MDQFLHDLWQLIAQPGLLRENLAQIVSTLGGTASISLALKSGNFGGDDFFAKALRQAP